VSDATPTPDSPPSAAPPKDPLALGLGSLGSGVGFGGACMTASQIALRIFPDRIETLGYYSLSAGLIAAIGVGGTCGFYRSYSLDSIWQRGVIAVLAAVGAILVGFLAAPIDRFFGVIGMMVWLALNIVFGVATTRWALRGKGEEGSGKGTP
jgi:hypothetical protein